METKRDMIHLYGGEGGGHEAVAGGRWPPLGKRRNCSGVCREEEKVRPARRV